MTHDTTITKVAQQGRVRTSKKRGAYREKRADTRQEQESNQSRAHDRQGTTIANVRRGG